MKGELAEGVVPNLLRELYVGRRTGTLTLEKPGEKQSLRLRRGHIVNAHTNVKEDRLGETLVRRGLLTEDDFARATEVALQDNKRLGQAFLELGILDDSGLEDAIALHIHTLLSKVFTWNEGRYAFEEEEESPGELTLKLSTADLILEGVKAISDPDVVVYLLGDRDQTLNLSSDPLLRFQQLQLSPTDGFVLSRVDGTMSAREIEGMIPLPPEEVQKSLLGLLFTGIVEYEEAASPKKKEKAPDAAHPAPTSPPPEPAPPTAPPPPASHPPPEPEEPAPEEKPRATPRSPPAPPKAEPRPPAPPPSAAPPKPPEVPPRPVETPKPTTPPAPRATPATVQEPAVAAQKPTEAGDGPSDERRKEIEEAFDGLKEKNHFEVLGLERSATEAQVKEAYFKLAKRFHPDVHHGANLGDLRDKLEAVFVRVGEAYDVLRDTGKRRDFESWLGRPKPRPDETQAARDEPDPRAEEKRAEAAVMRAQALFDKEQYWDAIQEIEPVVDRMSGTIRFRAQLVLARCYLQNPKWVMMAKERLEAAVKENPKARAGYALLADLYKQQGLKARAAGLYRKVLELEPGDKAAAEALAEIERGRQKEAPAQEEGKGLLKKIFGR